ncbi:MAG: hypothetical protein AAGU12_15030 [Clostridiales bacterium]
MVNLLESADDSNGVVGGEIEESLALIREVTENNGLSLTDQANIFQMLTEEAIHRRYEGWSDWRLELLGSRSCFTSSSKSKAASS